MEFDDVFAILPTWCGSLHFSDVVIDSAASTASFRHPERDYETRLSAEEDYVLFTTDTTTRPGDLILETESKLEIRNDLIHGLSQSLPGNMILKEGTVGNIEIVARVYLDGISKHIFALTVSELAKTADQLSAVEKELDLTKPQLHEAQRAYEAALDEVEKTEKELSAFIEDVPGEHMVEEIEGSIIQPVAQPSGESRISCPNCGHLNPPSKKFCTNCGHSFS